MVHGGLFHHLHGASRAADFQVQSVDHGGFYVSDGGLYGGASF